MFRQKDEEVRSSVVALNLLDVIKQKDCDLLKETDPSFLGTLCRINFFVDLFNTNLKLHNEYNFPRIDINKANIVKDELISGKVTIMFRNQKKGKKGTINRKTITFLPTIEVFKSKQTKLIPPKLFLSYYNTECIKELLSIYYQFYKILHQLIIDFTKNISKIEKKFLIIKDELQNEYNNRNTKPEWNYKSTVKKLKKKLKNNKKKLTNISVSNKIRTEALKSIDNIQIDSDSTHLFTSILKEKTTHWREIIKHDYHVLFNMIDNSSKRIEQKEKRLRICNFKLKDKERCRCIYYGKPNKKVCDKHTNKERQRFNTAESRIRKKNKTD